MKKLLLFGYLSFICVFVAQSQQEKIPPAHTDSLPGPDTFARQLPLTFNDPKKGFKDLFVNTGISSGVNTTRLNPLAINFVQDYIDKHSKNLYKMKEWAKPYFDMIDGVLRQHGIPGELKYLSVIESDLHAYAISWAGAVGPWQFMAGTARRMGLKVNADVDERTDYFKSTHAAARYLTELYSIYGDWLLVIAAYNGGTGNVNSAIRRSGSKDFWSLQNYLPSESQMHVKKFIATHYIMEGQGGLTTLTKDETKNFLFTTGAQAGVNKILSPEEEANIKTLTISGKYNSLVIAKYTQMDIVEFNRLNPEFDKGIANNGNYDLRLPIDKMNLFYANKFKILDESIQVLLNSANEPAKK
jgi:membrane-bound lytic murein transglycosylase D